MSIYDFSTGYTFIKHAGYHNPRATPEDRLAARIVKFNQYLESLGERTRVSIDTHAGEHTYYVVCVGEKIPQSALGGEQFKYDLAKKEFPELFDMILDRVCGI